MVSAMPETFTRVRVTWEVITEGGGVFHTSSTPTAAEAMADAIFTLRGLDAMWEELKREGRKCKWSGVRLAGVRRRVATTVEIIETGALQPMSEFASA